MVRILKSLRFPPQNRAISPDTRLPSPPRSLTEMTESRISVILFCKNSFYLQSRPPSSREVARRRRDGRSRPPYAPLCYPLCSFSSRDVFHRRRLWRIQTMKTPKVGCRRQTEGVKNADRLAPKDAALCVVPPSFTPKRMPLCAVSGAPCPSKATFRARSLRIALQPMGDSL